MAQTQHISRTSRLPSLTGLRFVAASLVFFFHVSQPMIGLNNPFANVTLAHVYDRLFSAGGRVGVSFFFVLSGFVLTWSAKPNDTVSNFIKRRMLKIYPNHVVTWAIAMFFLVAPGTSPKVWLPNLFLIQAWFPNGAILIGVNRVSWSLSCELLFYCLFPLILPLVQRIPAVRLWLCAGVAVVGLVAAQALIVFFTPSVPVLPGWDVPALQFWLTYFFPPLRLFEFVIGMLMARILMTNQWIRCGFLTASLFAVIGYAIDSVAPFPYNLNVVFVVPIALLISAAAATDTAGRPTLFASSTMVWLGEMSFAFYMVHLEVLYGIRALLKEPTFSTPAAVAIVVMEFSSALLLAWVLYMLVERPIMKLWRKVGDGE
jgi:peptidoglycan/LPS O-acetylase OafA/YrhL